MPGWHEAAKDLVADGKLRMIGIVQEQHGERARLFMQWKGMDWPLMVDSLNLLGVGYVPITVAVDEHGIVRHVVSRRTDPREFLNTFLDAEYDPPTGRTSASPSMGEGPEAGGGAREAARREARAGVLRGGPGAFDRAIERYSALIAARPEDPALQFEAGVALRKRHDSAARRPGDFQAAVRHWQRALEIDPNNYIWRRRIQQYGPRLDKPYPFYDWVAEARSAIRARGESPVELPVEPAGAEIAEPAEAFPAATDSPAHPDPEGKVFRDPGRYVEAEVTTVPGRVEPGGTARVHVTFRPRSATGAHWNNEARGLRLWLPPATELQSDTRLIELDLPRTAVSQEPRAIEFELRVDRDAPPGEASLAAVALYYVCEGRNGACLYRRQDVTIEVDVER